MSEPTDESWTDSYQTRAGAVVHRAPAHNCAEEVWEEQVDGKAVVLRMSSAQPPTITATRQRASVLGPVISGALW